MLFIDPLEKLPAPEPPLTYFVVGYIISGLTAVRLTLKLNGLDPDNLPKGHHYANRLPPPPGTHLIGDDELIRDSIRKYMISKGLKPEEAGVAIAFTMVDGDLSTVLVTQSCFLPHGYEGRPAGGMRSSVVGGQW